MTERREHRWTNRRGVIGGLAMFVIEALVIAVLVGVAFIVSVVVLAIL